MGYGVAREESPERAALEQRVRGRTREINMFGGNAAESALCVCEDNKVHMLIGGSQRNRLPFSFPLTGSQIVSHNYL